MVISAIMLLLLTLQSFAAAFILETANQSQLLHFAIIAPVQLTAVCLFPFILWITTVHTVDTRSGEATTTVIFLIRRRRCIENVIKMRIDSSLAHRLLGGCRLRFTDLYGNVILDWNYVSIDDEIKRRLRRYVLLRSALQAGSSNVVKAYGRAESPLYGSRSNRGIRTR